MGSWSNSRTVTKQAWGVVKENPYMLLFPVVGGILSLVVVLAVAGIGVASLGLSNLEHQASRAAETGKVDTTTMVVGIIVLILAAYLGTLITQIFMGGLVKAADEELHGRDSSFGAGVSAALRRLGPLMGWATIQTAVGWLLSAIRGNGSDNALVAILRLALSTLLAVAWSIISFFVLPLIILRGKGPIEAIKQSVALIRATWGMQVAGGVRIGGLIFLLAVLPGMIFTAGGLVLMFAEQGAIGAPLAILGIVIIIVAQVFVSALRAVFSVALLHWAEQGEALGPFAAADLRSAVRVRS